MSYNTKSWETILFLTNSTDDDSRVLVVANHAEILRQVTIDCYRVDITQQVDDE
jgi:hypothetical protein